MPHTALGVWNKSMSQRGKHPCFCKIDIIKGGGRH